MATKVRERTLGQRIRAAEFVAFRIAETRYAPDARLALHEHDFTYLSLVLRGGFDESVGRNIESARSASVVLMPRGVAHGEHMGPLGAQSFTITLKAPFLKERSRDQGQLENWRWFHGGPVARIMFSAYKEWLLADAATELGLNELLLKLSEAIGGAQELKSGATRRCVSAAVERLHAPTMSMLCLAELAAELGKDPAYLARAFRQRICCTMSQYRRRLWVRHAAHLLASTDIPLAQVALSSGFTDQSHLCRVFKAEMGVTPKAYRDLTGPR
jgi:AraC family transcriptional regulator